MGLQPPAAKAPSATAARYSKTYFSPSLQCIAGAAATMTFLRAAMPMRFVTSSCNPAQQERRTKARSAPSGPVHSISWHFVGLSKTQTIPGRPLEPPDL
jgi:hypothetical protein